MAYYIYASIMFACGFMHLAHFIKAKDIWVALIAFFISLLCFGLMGYWIYMIVEA